MEILQIIAVVAIIGIAIYKEYRKKSQKKNVRVRERAIREVSALDTVVLDCKKEKPVTKTFATVKNANKVEAKQGLKSVETDSVRLKTRIDARKAFIYSEIFNRKY